MDSLSLSLSLHSPLICEVITSVAVFLLDFYHIFGVGLPAYFFLATTDPLLREHIFVGFNKFRSLVCWCAVIYHHRPHGPTLYRRVR